MSLAWPAALPPLAELDGYTETPPDLALRSSVEAGPAKTRPRWSAGATRVSGRLLLDAAQAEALAQFYRAATLTGALVFEAPHPRTGLVARLRFTRAPELAHLAEGGGLWRAQIELEAL
jgi:hypothetical protein